MLACSLHLPISLGLLLSLFECLSVLIAVLSCCDLPAVFGVCHSFRSQNLQHGRCRRREEVESAGESSITVTRSEALAYACDPFPDLQQLRRQELKDELQTRGLDTSGLKAALVERLEAALADAPAASNATAAEPAAEATTAAAANGADAKPAEGGAADGKV